MVNSYSSQINLLNRFNHDEGLNGLCKSQVKLDEGSLSTTAQDRLEKISLQTSFGSLTCSLDHKFIKKIKEFAENTDKRETHLRIFFLWFLYHFRNKPASTNSYKKSHHDDHIACLGSDEAKVWDWYCNKVTITPVTTSRWSVVK